MRRFGSNSDYGLGDVRGIGYGGGDGYGHWMVPDVGLFYGDGYDLGTGRPQGKGQGQGRYERIRSTPDERWREL